MTPRVKPPHTLVSVLHWLWHCRATALSARAHLTLLLGKNTLPFPAFGNLNFVSPPHRRAYTSMPKLCPNIRFPHQQDFFPIRSVTKSSTSRFSLSKNLRFCTRFCSHKNRPYSLENNERYNIVLVKRSTFTFYNKSVPCHLIQYMFVSPTTYLKLLFFIGYKDKTSSWHLTGSPIVVAMG